GALQNVVIAASFLYTLYLLWTYRWSTTWGPMLMLVVASGIYAVCNLLYVHALLTRTYLPSDVINMSWLLRFPYSSGSDRLLLRERWVEAVIPALLIIIMVVVAVSSATSLTPRMVGWTTTLFVLFAIILGVREALIQSDAQRLTDELLLSNRRLNETIGE